uniref:ORFI n=1 Tax=Banana streak OL virus TaxID=328671 RepID=L7NZI9_9VIRU|nr:ORFI [Banana streak OL virus]
MVEKTWDQKFQEFLNSSELTQAQLEYLDLATEAKVSNKDLAHNLHINTYRLSLTGKVLWTSGRKNRDLLVQIIGEQEAQKKDLLELQNLSKIVRSQRNDLKKAHEKLDVLSDELKALRKDYLKRRPLSKEDVEELVLRISEQPKFIEKQTEALTEELTKEVQNLKKIIHDFERKLME